MKLENLCGEHWLSGLEFGTAEVESYFNDIEETEAIRFTVDNHNYLVLEDPDDGYRSYCSDIFEVDESPKFTFPGVRVYCYMGEETESEILIMRDIMTNKVILKIGTDTGDSYYPCCIFDWRPENMSINLGKDAK